jgi:DNA-binding transcriptional MerR regulator
MTTNELCRRTRLTPRQIQWWCEKGVVHCGSPRGRRDFDETQSLVAAIVAELRRKGVSLPRIRRLKLREPQGEYLVLNGAKAHLWCK